MYINAMGSKSLKTASEFSRSCFWSLILVLNVCAGMEHLVKELSLLLKLLENESVSSATAEKMSVVRNLVKQLQPSGEIEQQIHNS